MLVLVVLVYGWLMWNSLNVARKAGMQAADQTDYIINIWEISPTCNYFRVLENSRCHKMKTKVSFSGIRFRTETTGTELVARHACVLGIVIFGWGFSDFISLHNYLLYLFMKTHYRKLIMEGYSKA